MHGFINPNSTKSSNHLAATQESPAATDVYLEKNSSVRDIFIRKLENRKTKKTLIAMCNLHHIMTSKTNQNIETMNEILLCK